MPQNNAHTSGYIIKANTKATYQTEEKPKLRHNITKTMCLTNQKTVKNCRLGLQ